ncbi:type II toxin-antitoxin system death-on-curing family toxin [Hugenholtzia roseola]|uniref:type II toxin-antitoxin system death-on-curing family toxin n=1 Tax=Hugenholtzia roseola TaxID=1002 RepID=UPI00040999CA|nr:type II toxin-antitoxin system death-on-curing family toxin [Hugenholtzia roseola]
MNHLEKQDIILINKLTIADVGGNFVPPYNFLHEESLDYLLEAAQMEIFGEPLYPTIPQKAGLYMFSIISNHIFQDGNKRTGLEAALLFLQLNGYDLIIDEEMLINFTLSVASGEQTLETVQAWFEKHIQQK